LHDDIRAIYKPSGKWILAQTTPIDREDLTQLATALHTTQRYFRVNRRDISFLRFILEAYEGVAVLTTVDPGDGIVKVLIAPGSERVVADVLDAMCASRDILIEPLPDPPSAVRGDA
jgi:hypothetical protein